jgi:predicted CoA-binding protein
MPNNRIAEFYYSESFAIFGMSRSRKNFAWSIYNSLVRAGREVFPVHPGGGEAKGIRFYDSLESLPGPPKAAILCLNLKKHDGILQRLKAAGIERVWLQQGSFNDSILKEAETAGLNPITGCALMYMPGASFPHRLHRFLYELFKKG